jgi:hypothetical protein
VAFKNRTLGRYRSPGFFLTPIANLVSFQTEMQLAVSFIDRTDRLDAMSVEVMRRMF